MGDQPVIPFDQLTVGDVEVAGGKGANLGELTRAGLPVPPGFVITAPAYLDAMDAGGVRGEVRSAAGTLDPDDSAALSAAAEHLHDLVRKAGVPDAAATGDPRRLPRDRRRRRRRPVLGHGRGHRRYVVRRDERDLHERRAATTS